MNTVALTAISKIGIGIALIYVILKIMNKGNENSFYNRNKSKLFHLHILGPKIAIIVGIIHGVGEMGNDVERDITGWVIIGIIVILTGFGAFLSIKHDSKPMNEEENERWIIVRLIKWILTLLLFIALIFHTVIFA